MKKVLLGKSWKTSAAGLATGLALYAKLSGIGIVDWKTAAVSLGVAVVGRLASDQTKTEEEQARDAERFPNP
jgi:hypothetical protein